jgi:predicted aconitase with swiveling domain
MIFRGTVLVAGEGRGQALVLSEPLSLWGGLDPETGEIIDRRHPRAGCIVTGRVLVLPGGRGSSSASSILLEAVRAGTAPVAILARERDGILALGAAVAQEMYGSAPPVVMLKPRDYVQIEEGAIVWVAQNGDVTVCPSAT